MNARAAGVLLLQLCPYFSAAAFVYFFLTVIYPPIPDHPFSLARFAHANYCLPPP